VRALAVIAAVLAFPATALAAHPRTTLPDVEDEVMCITCGTALNVSQAPSADRERALIRRLIARGETKDQIKRAMVAQYGPKVLAEPHEEASWLIPVLLAILAAGTVALTVRRWRRTTQLEPLPTAELDAAEQARLDRDMAGYDL
jgi:cytochrome c-type biogenesis protein CcmH